MGAQTALKLHRNCTQSAAAQSFGRSLCAPVQFWAARAAQNCAHKQLGRQHSADAAQLCLVAPPSERLSVSLSTSKSAPSAPAGARRGAALTDLCSPLARSQTIINLIGGRAGSILWRFWGPFGGTCDSSNVQPPPLVSGTAGNPKPKRAPNCNSTHTAQHRTTPNRADTEKHKHTDACHFRRRPNSIGKLGGRNLGMRPLPVGFRANFGRVLASFGEFASLRLCGCSGPGS